MGEIVLAARHDGSLLEVSPVVAREPGTGSSEVARLERTDDRIIQLWLAGKSANTREAYQADADRLFDYASKPLNQITLEDLVGFSDQLLRQGLSAATRKRILAAVKSLFTFAATKIQYLTFNVAAALTLPKPKETLNERILSERQVEALIAAAGVDGSQGTAHGVSGQRPPRSDRNRAIVELLYLVGLRAEELATLCWRDVREDGGGAVLTVFGKGSKTRHVHLEADTYALLLAQISPHPSPPPEYREREIFSSRSGGAMSTVQIWRIVSAAARRAAITGCSPHWLRHAHATHAIDHGCDVRTLQQSLGHASATTTERYIHCRPKKSSGGFLRRPA